jgi:hypothetical protein
VVAGTPQYMSPEQAQGQAIDHRADLFSLGSTLYATCTGRAPFRAESAMAVLRRVCDEQPRPIRSINPDVPAWLAALIEKLHAKDPARRFQTASEVADLMSRCLAHVQQPDTVALPAELTQLAPRAAGPWQRAHWATAAAVLVALGAGMAAVAWTPIRDAFLTAQDTATPQDARDQQKSPLPSPKIEDPAAELAAARAQAAALEADMKWGPVDGYGDPTDAVLGQTWRRLETLERELGAHAP